MKKLLFITIGIISISVGVNLFAISNSLKKEIQKVVDNQLQNTTENTFFMVYNDLPSNIKIKPLLIYTTKTGIEKKLIYSNAWKDLNKNTSVMYYSKKQIPPTQDIKDIYSSINVMYKKDHRDTYVEFIPLLSSGKIIDIDKTSSKSSTENNEFELIKGLNDITIQQLGFDQNKISGTILLAEVTMIPLGNPDSDMRISLYTIAFNSKGQWELKNKKVIKGKHEIKSSLSFDDEEGGIKLVEEESDDDE